MQKILGHMRRAIQDYNMIEDGDKIAVALSGGKDSTSLLLGLKNLQRFYPKKFEIVGITINPGFDGFDTKDLKKLCDEIGVEYFVENTHIKEIVFDIRNEKNPCSMCANFRRGALNSVAAKLGCNKIALGHNEDDVLETMLLNLFYTGSIDTFAPMSYMDRSEMTLIRPLIYVPEKYISGFVKKNNIPILKKVCPMDGVSKREDMKKMLVDLERNIPRVRANMYGAIKRSNIKGWNEKNK